MKCHEANVYVWTIFYTPTSFIRRLVPEAIASIYDILSVCVWTRFNGNRVREEQINANIVNDYFFNTCKSIISETVEKLQIYKEDLKINVDKNESKDELRYIITVNSKESNKKRTYVIIFHCARVLDDKFIMNLSIHKISEESCPIVIPVIALKRG